MNGLVHELYFPEELHATGLRQKFEELQDAAHPLRQALDKLSTLETVRIIEGRA